MLKPVGVCNPHKREAFNFLTMVAKGAGIIEFHRTIVIPKAVLGRQATTPRAVHSQQNETPHSVFLGKRTLY